MYFDVYGGVGVLFEGVFDEVINGLFPVECVSCEWDVFRFEVSCDVGVLFLG